MNTNSIPYWDKVLQADDILRAAPAPALERTITVTTTYQASAWRTQYFTPTELADPAISGPQADPPKGKLHFLLPQL